MIVWKPRVSATASGGTAAARTGCIRGPRRRKRLRNRLCESELFDEERVDTKVSQESSIRSRGTDRSRFASSRIAKCHSPRRPPRPLHWPIVSFPALQLFQMHATLHTRINVKIPIQLIERIRTEFQSLQGHRPP